MSVSHDYLLSIMKILPTDYSTYGGLVERWSNAEISYPDCSNGCKFALWLKGDYQYDWCVCVNPKSPRVGMLTFEHMAGYNCFEQ